MSKSKLIVTKHSFTKVVESNEQVIITFDTLKNWITSGEIIRHLFKYYNVELKTYDYNLLGKPFLTAILMRLMSRRYCEISDEKGLRLSVDTKFLFSLAHKFVKGYFEQAGVVKHTLQICQELRRYPEKRFLQNLSNRPIYLRTDLWFGVRSGGSVGHIAGVLNSLDKFAGKPLFFTTDTIPTVRQDIEAYTIIPSASFLWDYAEMPSLQANDHFVEEVDKVLKAEPISFVYQRYSTFNYSGLRLACKRRVPFILEYNGSEIWISRNWGKPFKHEKIALEIEDINLQLADVVVVVSAPMRNELIHRGVDPEKILVNPNGVDVTVYCPEVDGTEIRNRYNLTDKTVIGFIGTFGKWHGAEILVKAFGAFLASNPESRNQVQLLLIGDGVTMPEVRRLVKELALEDKCTFTGLVPQSEGPSYLAACDILVSPQVPNPDGTPFFGSPTKLFEYMAMGKAIVASDLDQLGEVIENRRTGLLVKPGSINSLAQALEELAKNAELRHHLGRAARQEVIARYTWEEHTHHIINKLQERCKK